MIKYWGNKNHTKLQVTFYIWVALQCPFLIGWELAMAKIRKIIKFTITLGNFTHLSQKLIEKAEKKPVRVPISDQHYMLTGPQQQN